MHALRLCVSSCLVLAIAGGSAAQSFDVNGNPLAPAGGIDTLGTVLSQVNGPAAKHSGLTGANARLAVTSAYDSAATIYLCDWYTGAVTGNVPIDDASDFGLAYDTLRSRYVTTNPGTHLLKTFDGVSPVPVSSFLLPSPHGSAVGAAYDSGRDRYWICAWATNTIAEIHPVTGAVGTVYSTASFGCTSPAGLAHDPTFDELIVGGRTQNQVFVINAATGALVSSFAAPDGGNNPQGVGIFPQTSSVWTSSWNSGALSQVDAGHAPTLSILFSPGSLSVNLTNLHNGDCRLFFDVIPPPYLGNGPFGGATVSQAQLLFTLNWPAGVPIFSTTLPFPSLTYGPFALPAGITLNAFIATAVGPAFFPPLSAAGGTTL